MPARTFEDSAGAVWEVFEVHRASQKPGAVSAGLEKGWLAFVSGESKRRLAPFPVEWVTASVPELERLCSAARKAIAPKFPPTGGARPAIRRKATSSSGSDLPTSNAGSGAVEPKAAMPAAGSPLLSLEGEGSPVEQTVRAFAHQARLTNLPAIEAMVRLKAMLVTKFPGADSEARDMRSVRRWFVEAFYFERDA